MSRFSRNYIEFDDVEVTGSVTLSLDAIVSAVSCTESAPALVQELMGEMSHSDFAQLIANRIDSDEGFFLDLIAASSEGFAKALELRAAPAELQPLEFTAVELADLSAAINIATNIARLTNNYECKERMLRMLGVLSDNRICYIPLAQ